MGTQAFVVQYGGVKNRGRNVNTPAQSKLKALKEGENLLRTGQALRIFVEPRVWYSAT